jgi:hypothetical protein
MRPFQGDSVWRIGLALTFWRGPGCTGFSRIPTGSFREDLEQDAFTRYRAAVVRAALGQLRRPQREHSCISEPLQTTMSDANVIVFAAVTAQAVYELRPPGIRNRLDTRDPISGVNRY